MGILDALLDLLTFGGGRRWGFSACLAAGLAAIVALWWFGIPGDPGWRWAMTAATFIVAALIGCVWEFGRPLA